MDDPSDDILLSVRGLRKYFPILSKGWRRRRVGWVKAVDDIGFDLRRGETLALVGESGCGKTTAGRTLLRALAPTAGQAWFHRADQSRVDLCAVAEKDLKPLRREMQMIFQDPFSSLNPRMTVGSIVEEPFAIHGVGTKAERREWAERLLSRVGLRPEYRSRYPHAFSGGQRQRVGIARALALRPRLIVADEAVSALDVSVQAQVLNLLGDLREEFGLTYIFVAHNLGVVRHFCDRVAVMYAGRLAELSPTRDLFESPAHPYAAALLSAVPHPDPDRKMRCTLEGEAADPGKLPPGCAFAPRCPRADERCRRERPEPVAHADPRRIVACHHPDV